MLMIKLTALRQITLLAKNVCLIKLLFDFKGEIIVRMKPINENLKILMQFKFIHTTLKVFV